MNDQKLRTDLFDYDLPREMIARYPPEKRGESRLLVYHRRKNLVEHRAFRDIAFYLGEGDVVVLNNTRVVPARLIGKKRGTGGRVELLLLGRTGEGRGEALFGSGSRPRVGMELEFRGRGAVIEAVLPGKCIVNFLSESNLTSIIEENGLAPLPPYIKRKDEEALRLRDFDIDRYQTIYAKQKGAVAAPTAGLHFSGEILDSLREKGVELAEITLHVGIGTFRPVKAEHVQDHVMDEEAYDIRPEAADAINEARRKGRKVLVAGTTAVRALESVALTDRTVEAGRGATSLFIYPPYLFKVVEELLTNFHLPRSTLVMMVAALIGREKILSLYEEAKAKGYRFYSYGDAMLLLND